MKYLHSGRHSREDLADAFAISERALSDDLNTLPDGFEFMGTTMQINELERGSNTYNSLIHPVFLALNTAEIYAVTIGLKRLAKETIFSNELNKISDSIYTQLSNYARNMVDKHAELDELYFEGSKDRKFINSFELIKESRPFSYYLKDSTPCRILVHTDGKQCEFIGTIKLAPQGTDRFKKVTVTTASEELVLNLDDIIRLSKI